jgi:N-acetylneuraminate synthase
LQRVGLPAWKVASGEVTNLPLLKMMAATGLPVMLSSGMSRWSELDEAVAVCRKAGAPLAVFQCTTQYPCPPEKVGLNLLAEFQQRFACPVGLSDHTGQIYAGLAAAALGASLIEVHVAFSRQIFGPDVPASLTFPELKQLVEGARAVHAMVQNRVEKEVLATEFETLRRTFQKCVVARRDLVAGTVLEPGDLALKKAGAGLPPAQFEALIGRKLARDMAADTPLKADDVQPPLPA